MSTHNLCFRAKIRKKVYPCKPQFHYIKVGCKGSHGHVILMSSLFNNSRNDDVHGRSTAHAESRTVCFTFKNVPYFWTFIVYRVTHEHKYFSIG